MVVLEGLEWKGLYCNTLVCITEIRDELYCKTVLYCGWKGCRRQNRIAIQNCIVTAGMGAGQALGAAGARQGLWRAARAHSMRRQALRHAGTRGVRCRARQGAAGARQARGLGAGRTAWACGLALGCALGALGLFSIRIDSVLFLSQFLDIVREPGS